MLCVFACVFSVFKCVLECVQRIVGWLSELECKFKINTELSPAQTSASRRHAISDCGIFKLRNIWRRGTSSNSARWQMWTDTLSWKTMTKRLKTITKANDNDKVPKAGWRWQNSKSGRYRGLGTHEWRSERVDWRSSSSLVKRHIRGWSSSSRSSSSSWSLCPHTWWREGWRCVEMEGWSNGWGAAGENGEKGNGGGMPGRARGSLGRGRRLLFFHRSCSCRWSWRSWGVTGGRPGAWCRPLFRSSPSCWWSPSTLVLLFTGSAAPSSSPGSIFTLLSASDKMGGVSVLVLDIFKINFVDVNYLLILIMLVNVCQFLASKNV